MSPFSRFLPFHGSLSRAVRLTNTIHLGHLRGDLFGGLTAAVVALPMALTFGVASGAGAEAGLWGAALVGLFAALFGGTPTLISEPTGPMTVVMTAVIANLTASDPENGLAMAFTVVMMAGLFQILFGALRLGRYVTLMPYAVISGFMSGIGIILIVLQLAPFLGQASPQGGVIGTLGALPELLAGVRASEAALAVAALAIIVLMPRRLRRIVPAQLVALVVVTLISLALLADEPVRRIGEIPAGLPELQVPTFTLAQLRLMFVDAIALAMLGCIDALLTSMIADSLTRTEHDSDRELVGQGLGNLASGLFGGIAGAGATMGTVVNIQGGARTALSGLVRAGALLLVIFAAADLAATIPLAVLAGIAVKVGVDIIDWRFLRRAHRVSLPGALIMYGVILLTVLVDLIVAVGVGVFVANILTIERLSALQARSVRAVTDADDRVRLDPQERELLDAAAGRVLLFHLSGPMIFGVAKAIAREHQAIERCSAVVFDLSEVPQMDVTASMAVENAVREAIGKGREVFLVVAAEPSGRALETVDLFSIVPAERVHAERADALRQALARVDGARADPARERGARQGDASAS